MATKGVFPSTDSEFSIDINNIITYLNVPANKSRLVITTAAQANLATVTTLVTTAGTGWNTVYAQSINPSANTTTITQTKNSQRAQIERLLRSIYDDIPQSVLTQTDRDTLHIALRDKTATPVPVPPNEPVIAIKGRGHLYINFNITDPSRPQTQAKPEGVDTIEIQSAFLPINTPKDQAENFPAESDFRHLESTGKFLYKRVYEMSHLAGTDFLRARYVNTRKQPGPWSEIISVVVS
jgi:hypothetical protein